MKVLWFTNTPCAGVERLSANSFGGTWLRALDRQMQGIVDLHIAFNYPKPVHPFEHERTKYYPITPKFWRLAFLKNFLSNRVVDEEDCMRYLSIVEAVKPDIIHIHGTENAFGCIIGMTSIPVVVSIQGVIALCEHKFFSGVGRSVAASFRMPMSFGEVVFFKSYIRDYVKFQQMSIREAKNLSKAKYIIGRTAWDRRVTSVIAPLARYYRNNEILADRYYSEIWNGKLNKELIVHTTTNNELYKGLETVCLALDILLTMGIRVEWRIAGLTEKAPIVRVVQKLLKDRFPRRSLVFLGSQSVDSLIKRMLEAHIYVMPSHIENSSNSLCEAMMLGMPCIATFAGGTSTIIKDGENGVLIQDGDPWAMAGAVIELYRNPSAARQLGSRAREISLARHDRTQITNDLVAIYKDVIDDAN